MKFMAYITLFQYFLGYRANAVHNGTFLCRDSVPDLFWIHVIVTATQPHFTRPGFSGITVDYGKSVSIPCAAEGKKEYSSYT